MRSKKEWPAQQAKLKRPRRVAVMKGRRGEMAARGSALQAAAPEDDLPKRSPRAMDRAMVFDLLLFFDRMMDSYEVDSRQIKFGRD